MLFLAVDPKRSVLRLRELASGSEVDVMESRSRAMVSLGHLLFQRNSQLWAQPFDERSGLLSGEPTRLADNVAWGGNNSRAGFHVSSAGVLLHRMGLSSRGAGDRQMIWRDRTGKELGTVAEPDQYLRPALSPDEDRLAVQVGDVRLETMRLFGEASPVFSFVPAGRDGLRFLMSRQSAETLNSQSAPLQVTLHWQQLLPR